MKFTKLRIAGFKTFVDPTEFLIEPGLTGIIGPNGCGKSNLVEAMRWVMGETSSRSMRASGMDDVIFSGSGGRPSRNMAEVTLTLDNGARAAPAAFNDADVLEVSRRIEREQGSTYRVNGRETRARDVQLLFADASSGSRSPAMVRQGQIGEMISAKPQERRRILEEAAGVAGLHSRRHEAELRLKAASENLLRLEDILQQIDGRAKGLERQARQAARYRDLAGQIRRAEALLALIQHNEAQAALADAQASLAQAGAEVEETTRAQGEAARAQGLAAHALPALREGELACAAELQRQIIARETLDGEERRAKARGGELKRRIEEMSRDLARERALVADAAGALERLEEEARALQGAGETQATQEADGRARLIEAEAALAVVEAELSEAQERRAGVEARRVALEASLRDERQRLARAEAELARIIEERAALARKSDEAAEAGALGEALEAAQARADALEDEISTRETACVEARAAEAQTRQRALEAERKAQKLATEAQTLAKLLTGRTGDFWPPVTEEIAVARGYEAALGAALGDDLDASTNPSAPAHWMETDRRGDPALPEGCEPLSELVTGPAALARRLNQIGLVARADGPRLRALLLPGQRLVSQEGDLWRWDGFAQAAEAPTPAARRLAEKNRLGDLQIEAEAARDLAEETRSYAQDAEAALAAAGAAESEARLALKGAHRDLEAARAAHGAAERAQAAGAARLLALEETQERLTEARAEGLESYALAQAALDELEDAAALTERLELCRLRASRERAVASEARAALQTLAGEAEGRARRLEAVAREQESWRARGDGSGGQIEALEERLGEAREEFERLAEAPDAFLMARRNLLSAIEAAEAAQKEAADRRAAAETELAQAERAARAALEAMSAARERKARAEARLEAAIARAQDVLRHIESELDCAPADLPGLARLGEGEAAPPAAEVERRLETLKQDRERLGAVNLRAEEELSEAEGERSRLAAEHADLTEAIRRLRQAIASLNKEGRERLLAAFEQVQAHFKELFSTLFGGGSAELQLVESEDPLEAGLEIIARPPGKKPQVMTLLSGGEQALTAMSLIFAIFLTNPSPICVLDEVDAPLDDANVERFCDLLERMREKTQTRFVAITHNPITMARMNRLFGVTMAERGVSQLVCVDLEQAERLLDVG
ncbi:chromosome segregation SMC family protein [Methylocella sp.]|uniref:chromosome segregation SMC family protein n=1 Tax=Methylocella sp. TaxID=1978226 RepID=UPI0037843D8D